MNREVTIPIHLIRTQHHCAYEKEYVAAGIQMLKKKIEETPHFELATLLAKGNLESYEDTAYCRLCNKVLAIYKAKKEPLVRNYTKELVVSGLEATTRFVKLYKDIACRGVQRPVNLTVHADGLFSIQDGLHRTAISKALGHKDIQAQLIFMDSATTRLCNSLQNMYPQDGQKVLYIPIQHPIFSHWTVLRNSARWDIIAPHFSWSGAKVLDIGSYTGYFSHQAALAGATVLGLEPDATRYKQAIQLNKLLRLEVPFLQQSAEGYLQKSSKFDCTIMFSVLHWTLKTKGIKGVRNLLALVSGASPVLFLDMGQSHEPKVRKLEWDGGCTLDNKGVQNLVINNSCYTESKILGCGDTGRTVFKFGRRNRAASPIES